MRFAILLLLACATFEALAARPTDVGIDNPREFKAKTGRVQASLKNHRQGQGRMKDSTDEDLELDIDLGDGRNINVRVVKDSATTGSLTITAGHSISRNDKAQLENARKGLEIAASHVKNPRAGFAEKMLGYFSEAPDDHIIESRTIPISVIRVDTDIKGTAEARRRLLSHTCSDSYLGNLAYPNSNEPNCPKWGSNTEADDGSTCMCPYGGGGLWTGWYDTTRSPYQLDWVRYHGSDSNQCTGRCGAGCNSLDKEAFWDCFEHDSCVDHVGGSSFGGNTNCGDEFDHAADDYVVSYGWGCC